MTGTQQFSEPANQNHDDDLILAQSIADGSLDAWHEFLDTYAGLIYGVVRRRMLSEDEDTIRSIFVDVLKYLYDGEIGAFRGESSLATWLIVFTRNRAFDFMRKRHGRMRDPAGIDALCEFDRQVLRLFYMERLPLDIVVHVLGWRGEHVTVDEIVESMQRIEDVVHPRYLLRLDHEHQAKRYGVDSRRMLDYLAQLRQEYDDKVHGIRPDVQMMKKEAREIVEKIRALITELTAEEQQVASLWFDRRLPAPRIASLLGLKSQRRVYTIKERIIKKLRKSLDEERMV